MKEKDKKKLSHCAAGKKSASIYWTLQQAGCPDDRFVPVPFNSMCLVCRPEWKYKAILNPKTDVSFSLDLAYYSLPYSVNDNKIR